MNWKECVRFDEMYGIRSRFEWPVGEGKSGFDCNDAFTFNDISGALNWIITWPGDYILNSAAARSFFEMGPEQVVGNPWSAVLGILLLIGALLIVLSVLLGVFAVD